MVRLYGEGKYREAVAPAERALALREKVLGPNDPDVAQSLNNLAELGRARGAYAQAELLYARALDISEKALGPNHPLVATSLNNLAALYRDQGAYAKAALVTLTGPAMLHLATHGFYGWRAGLVGAATRGPTRRGPWLDRQHGHIGALPPPTHDLSDGLDQAGLAMADANRGPADIVTAREIAGFDWTGTQLVVLSACQMGLGAVASGDGIYGLRARTGSWS